MWMDSCPHADSNVYTLLSKLLLVMVRGQKNCGEGTRPFETGWGWDKVAGSRYFFIHLVQVSIILLIAHMDKLQNLIQYYKICARYTKNITFEIKFVLYFTKTFKRLISNVRNVYNPCCNAPVKILL